MEGKESNSKKKKKEIRERENDNIDGFGGNCPNWGFSQNCEAFG